MCDRVIEPRGVRKPRSEAKDARGESTERAPQVSRSSPAAAGGMRVRTGIRAGDGNGRGYRAGA